MKDATDDPESDATAREARTPFRFGAGFLADMSLIAAIILATTSSEWDSKQTILFISIVLFGIWMGYVAITGRHPPFGFGF